MFFKGRKKKTLQDSEQKEKKSRLYRKKEDPVKVIIPPGRQCPKCGNVNPPTATLCQGCGENIEPTP